MDAKAWVLCAIAVAALLAYVALRVRHNLQLYGTVVKHVKHLPIGTDWMTAVIFEVPLKGVNRIKSNNCPQVTSLSLQGPDPLTL